MADKPKRSKTGPKEPVDACPGTEAAYRRNMPIAAEALRPGTRTRSTDTDLTDYQYAFAVAYCGVARFNAAAAARIAGSTHHGSEGGSNPARTLNQPAVQAYIRTYLEGLKTEGIRVTEQRIEELVRLNNDLLEVQMRRAEDVRRRSEACENIPPEALSGLMIEVRRKDGSRSWELDKVLLDQRRGIFEEVARNLGERDSRLSINNAQITVNAETAESARSKLYALLNTDVIDGEVT